MILPPDADLTADNDKLEAARNFLLQVESVHMQLLDDLDYSKIDELQEDKTALKLYLTEEIKKTIIKKNMQPTAKSAVKDSVKGAVKGEVAGQDVDDEKLIVAVLDEVVGFGPVEALLRDESITDIFINALIQSMLNGAVKLKK